jgi:endonuclease/exonuclease/phosphatase (EEP) superfamily protein YafD
VHFRLQYFLASLLLFVVFAVLRNPRYAGVLLLAAVLNASLVLPWYFDNPPEKDGVELKLLLANILSTNTRPERLIELLDAEAPDIVLLQEVSPQWLMNLDELRTDYPWSYAEAREGNFGIALFSRLPLASATHVDSPPLGYPTIIATLETGGRAVRLVNSHPTIPVSPRLYEARNEHMESLGKLLQDQGNLRILVSDLNASMWDINYRALEERTGLRNVRRGFGIVPTWPTLMPLAMIPIDHVLVSSEVGVTDVRRGPRIGSDHLPLIVTLSL